MNSAVRMPAVAGRFYPRQPDQLRREVQRYLTAETRGGSKLVGREAHQSTPPAATDARGEHLVTALGCIAPHAGYIYSGHVAGAVYSSLDIPRHCVILCPNHTGLGDPLDTMTRTPWLTPFGEVSADAQLGEALLQAFPILHEDASAHRAEHAIEVHLPFLQERQPKLVFLPIAIGTSGFDLLERFGEALASVVGARPEKTLIVASSDMNHYESDAVTRIKDAKAIERVLALDPRGLWEAVMTEDISMCGFGPAVVMLTAAKRLGASSATLVKYATSGDISGDREQVVGYAGIVVS